MTAASNHPLATDLLSVLIQAESFIAGFEDDEGQNVGQLLAELRSAITRERTASPLRALQALDSMSWLDDDPCDNDWLWIAKVQSRLALSTHTEAPSDQGKKKAISDLEKCYLTVIAECPDKLPQLPELLVWIRDLLDGDTMPATFELFMDWLDVTTAYEQQDEGVSIEHHRESLQIAYQILSLHADDAQ